MSAQRILAPFAALALIVIFALLGSGLTRAPRRAFALGSPNQSQVAVLLSRGPATCEGPVAAGEPIGGVRVWGAGINGPSRLRMDVRDARTGAIIASGTTAVGEIPNAYQAPIGTAVGDGHPVSICLQAVGTHAFSLLGSPPVRAGVLLRQGGRIHPAEFSLVLTTRSRQSLLEALPEALRRAALFKADWIGQWTFWLLAGALLSTLGVAAAALTQSARDENDRSTLSTPGRSGPSS